MTAHALAAAHLALVFAAVIGWLTAAAQLADMHPGREILADAWRAARTACSSAWRLGWQGIDVAALRLMVRPVARALSAALVFAAAPAAVFELVALGGAGPFAGALCLAMAIGVAATTPCPWIRYVFIGDRRRDQHPFPGDDRRAR
jgi:hypothetical protein